MIDSVRVASALSITVIKYVTVVFFHDFMQHCTNVVQCCTDSTESSCNHGCFDSNRYVNSLNFCYYKQCKTFFSITLTNFSRKLSLDRKKLTTDMLR